MDLSRYPKLNAKQLGHLRHIHNLASQIDGEWHHMGAQESHQEFLDAYRYQIATMTYTAAAAHYHHQPMLRTLYKRLIRRLIHKMLLREVWGYWFNTSLGGIVTDPDLKELRKPWANPIVRENIMYSGHLLLMVSLFAMLFDDNEFEKKDALVFNWNPIFFGLGPERFTYNTQSLQDAIMAEMERNKYIGVCCEPNMVFVVCNQFPIIAMHYNDVRHGTKVADDLILKYLGAWEKKGMVGPGSLYPDAWLERQDRLSPAKDPSFTAWANAWMHSWRPDFVEKLWDKQSLGYITAFDDAVQLNPPAVGNAFRTLVTDEKAAPDKATYEKAKSRVKGSAKSFFPYTKPTFGYVIQWLSELGRPELDGLLRYADEHLHPEWENGGLYYPRQDKPFDQDLNWTHMDPFTGNSAIAYARLNIPNGQTIMWDAPWTAKTLSERPWVDRLDLSDGVDVVRAIYDEQKSLVLLTVRTWDSSTRRIEPVLKGLEAGTWTIGIGNKQPYEHNVSTGADVCLQIDVGGADLDVVMHKA